MNRDGETRCRHIATLALLATLCVLPAHSAIAGAKRPVRFVMHRVGRFRSEACGVADFNNDGKFDIVAGPYWYEAPSWKPHAFRSLEGKPDAKGRTHQVNDKGVGYWDDFMNAPLDVDGDGFADVVTCCWFSKELDWYR
ncbi:MAG: FG-GAP repeat domain-containing protein, partial [Planctomycetota bacterium]